MRKKIRLIGIIGSVVLLSWWITQSNKSVDSNPATIIPLSTVIPSDSLYPIQIIGDSTANPQNVDHKLRGLALGSFTSVDALQKAFNSKSILDTITMIKVSDSQNNLWYYAAIGPFKTENALQQKQKELQITFSMQPTVIVWPHNTTIQKYRLKL